MRRTTILAGALVAAACLGLAWPGTGAAADPDALWKIVHEKCAPNQAAKGQPQPCLAVDLAGDYAVLKDIRGRTQVLVIPTSRITGIESPALLNPAAPNYWQDAWAARRFVEKLAGRPIARDDIGLAVNSMDGRSQDQLHIHVDCLKANVRQALIAALPSIGFSWKPLPVPLAGERFWAMKLAGADLGARNPFKLLAFGEAGARAKMGLETLVVVGVTFGDGKPGFVLLSDRASLAAGDYASGGNLLAHDCPV
jgi:CDP-diacylglycerol pyrophosphatase